MKRQEMEQTREIPILEYRGTQMKKSEMEQYISEIMQEKINEIAENLEKLSVLSENRYTNFFDLSLVNSRLKNLINSLKNQIEVNQREEQAKELSKRVTHVGADHEPDYEEVSNHGKW